MPISGGVGPYGKYMFKCIGNRQTVFLSVCTSLRSCQQTGRFQELSIPASTCVAHVLHLLVWFWSL